MSEESGKSSPMPGMMPASSSPYGHGPDACLSIEKPSMEADRKQLEEPLPHREFAAIDIPEESTPDDAEGSLLSDPRFSAFLIQSPSMKYASRHPE